jgi:hypothetical protein
MAPSAKCVLNRYLNDDFSDGFGPTIFEDWASHAELDNYGLQVCKVTLKHYATQFEAFEAITKASSRGPLCHQVSIFIQTC